MSGQYETDYPGKDWSDEMAMKPSKTGGGTWRCQSTCVRC